MLAFSSCVSDASCRVIETDLHLTKDGVLVINHDPDTERTYGKKYLIKETNYDPELRILKNVNPPHESMPTFHKILEWLVVKNREVGNVKFMLDLKPVNDVIILDKIVEEMLVVENDINFWHDKIIFGLWTPAFYEHGIANHLLDHFPIINITLSMEIATQFLTISSSYEVEDPQFPCKLSGVSLIQYATWGVGHQLNDRFVEFYKLLVKELKRDLYLWTCNDQELNTFYCKLGVSGFLTDIPDQVTDLVNHADYTRETDLYKFYSRHDPINFTSKKGWKNYSTFKMYKMTEYAILNGYFAKKVPYVNGGKDTVGSYWVYIMKLLGII